MSQPAAEFRPAIAERWDDVEAVMRSCANGKNCWCAFWYVSNAAYQAGWGEANRNHLRNLVATGREPGLIGYVEGRPAVWVGVAPRRSFDRLNRSKTFAPLDDLEVWAVNCFIVAKDFRRQGLMRAMAEAAAIFALGRGAPGVEGYPVDPGPRTAAADLYLGTVEAFVAAGYREVARPLPRRAVMRRMAE